MSIFRQIFEKIGKKLGYKVGVKERTPGLLWEIHKRTGFKVDRLSKVSRSSETVAPEFVGKIGQLWDDLNVGTAREYLDLLADSEEKKKKR